MKGICIVGYGYWGPKLVRNFSNTAKGRTVWVCEENNQRRAQAAADFPSAKVSGSFSEVLADASIEAVVIATPVSTHYPLAKAALEAGKHVLVEKPLASTAEHASDLVRIAKERRLVLMVDHTFVYHSAVGKIKSLMDSGDVGKLQYIDSTRINLGLFQHDVNVLWDLAVHDISIVHYLVNERPLSVQAIGASHTNTGLENIGFLVMRYASGLFVHVSCSWISPVKIRHMLFGGDKKMVLYNDLNADEPIKVYDSGFTARNDEDRKRLMFDYRVGDVTSPKLVIREALAALANDFINSIETGNAPRSSGQFGADVVKVLAAAEKSIKQKGQEISLV